MRDENKIKKNMESMLDWLADIEENINRLEIEQSERKRKKIEKNSER